MKQKFLSVAAVVAIVCGTMGAVNQAQAEQVQQEMTMSQEVTYESIEVGDLPEPVSKAVAEGFTGYLIDEVYKGSDNSYKVIVSSGDVKATLFYTAEGELTKVEKP